MEATGKGCSLNPLFLFSGLEEYRNEAEILGEDANQ
jgi:hypothetical protein